MGMGQRKRLSNAILTAVFVVITVIYLYPIFLVLLNSFKSNASINTDTFAFPNSQTFMHWQNYIKGMTFGDYPFLKSVAYSFIITVLSSALILICTSMAAWYISRVGSVFCRFVYYLCVFSMIVPFQMVMFTLSKTADTLKLNTPWTIPVIYLGFGAGLAVFMFAGFVKSIPRSIDVYKRQQNILFALVFTYGRTASRSSATFAAPASVRAESTTMEPSRMPAIAASTAALTSAEA